MSAKHVGLGRGLGALIRDTSSSSPTTPSQDAGITTLPTASIRKGRWQPRQHFSSDALDELVLSIRERGVLQPLLLRQVEADAAGTEFELIAGERRFRAALQAGLQEVPAILMQASDAEALELALIENLQREDLNIVEEAEGYALLAAEFHLTQEEIADRVGKARTSVTNCLRLLSLPDKVKQLLAEGALSAGHAKVLLGIDKVEELERLAQRCAREGLSVRALENLLVPAKKRQPKTHRKGTEDIPGDHLRYLTERLHHHFGTSVRLVPSKTLANGKKVRGTIEIDYYSNEELDRLLGILGLTEDL